MATSFPTSLDSFTNPVSSDTLSSPSHAGQHSNANDAIEALQAKVGVDSSAVTTSLDYKVATLESAPTGRRNLLYNGAMQIAQRGTSASYGSSGSIFYHTADRWKTYANGAGSFTQSVEDDGPTGFTKSLKISCTASATLSAGAGKYFAQELEGQDLQHLAYGTASAKTMTFSFWVKSNVVTDYHTVVFHFKDGTNTYLLSKTYSVSAADTWEHKTITVPGATVGSGILNDNSAYGMSIRFWLSAGTNFTGSGVTNSNWAQWTDNEDIAPLYDQDLSTSGDYWQVTGLQLEVGSEATPFEHMAFGDELVRCQRYFEKSFDYGTAPAHNTGGLCLHPNGGSLGCGGNTYGRLEFAVSKRAAPTMRIYDSQASHPANQNWWRSYSGCSSGTAVTTGFSWTFTENRGVGYCQYSTGATYGFEWTAEAEL